MLILAEHFGVLPDDVEQRMSEYWRYRAWEFIQGKAIAQAEELKRTR